MGGLAIVDYGVGNLFSLRASLAHLGYDAAVTRDVRALEDAGGILLPGVGAFGDAAQKLRDAGLFVQVGGGIRSLARIEACLDAGVDRVILGTAAVKDPALLDAALARYGAQVAVGVDVRGGRVAVEGWLETSALAGPDFCRSLAARGVRCVIYTDIAVSYTHLTLPTIRLV